MNEPKQRSPWVIGIIISFVIVVLVNVGFIYVAVKGMDRIDPTYISEGR